MTKNLIPKLTFINLLNINNYIIDYINVVYGLLINKINNLDKANQLKNLKKRREQNLNDVNKLIKEIQQTQQQTQQQQNFIDIIIKSNKNEVKEIFSEFIEEGINVFKKYKSIIDNLNVIKNRIDTDIETDIQKDIQKDNQNTQSENTNIDTDINRIHRQIEQNEYEYKQYTSDYSKINLNTYNDTYNNYLNTIKNENSYLTDLDLLITNINNHKNILPISVISTNESTINNHKKVSPISVKSTNESTINESTIHNLLITYNFSTLLSPEPISKLNDNVEKLKDNLLKLKNKIIKDIINNVDYNYSISNIQDFINNVQKYNTIIQERKNAIDSYNTANATKKEFEEEYKRIMPNYNIIESLINENNINDIINTLLTANIKAHAIKFDIQQLKEILIKNRNSFADIAKEWLIQTLKELTSDNRRLAVALDERVNRIHGTKNDDYNHNVINMINEITSKNIGKNDALTVKYIPLIKPFNAINEQAKNKIGNNILSITKFKSNNKDVNKLGEQAYYEYFKIVDLLDKINIKQDKFNQQHAGGNNSNAKINDTVIIKQMDNLYIELINKYLNINKLKLLKCNYEKTIKMTLINYNHIIYNLLFIINYMRQTSFECSKFLSSNTVNNNIEILKQMQSDIKKKNVYGKYFLKYHYITINIVLNFLTKLKNNYNDNIFDLFNNDYDNDNDNNLKKSIFLYITFRNIMKDYDKIRNIKHIIKL